MHARRRRIPLVLPVLCIAALLAVGGALAAGDATSPRASLGGVWKGSYGGAFSGTFTIHWTETGSRLHGTIALSMPHGTYGINGSVGRNGAISFGAVGAGATYTGTATAKSMSGHYKTPQGGGTWSAHKTS
jgi:hypothetical protein